MSGQKLTIIGEQEEELKCDESDGSSEKNMDDIEESPGSTEKQKRFIKITSGGGTVDFVEDQKQSNLATATQQTSNNSVEKIRSSSYMKQKRQKSKQIKKILKERLNIDCLRMLCPDEEEAQQLSGQYSADKGNAMLTSSHNLNDSYHVLMREIGVEQPYELSQAFLDKNGTAPREQLNSFTEMFSVRDLLGVGAFGVVLLVKNRFTKEKSALKIIAKENLSERAQKILKNESTIMRTMDHPSVVSLKRIFENLKFIILEMELIPGGQIKRLFKLKDAAGSPRPLSDLEASKVMKDLLKGVAYVHARDIVHRDLKPENILLQKEREDCFEVKIVDFGLSAEQNWRKDTKERAGTPLYMAPEQVIGKGYSKKIDLWACGIIAYQLLTCGQHPCYQPGDDFYKKLSRIETHPLEFNFPASFTPLAKDFFLNLCSYPPSARYDAITALQHPWITRNDMDQIPLSAQQEFAMFQSEHQLRKAMRLAFFASLVKMRPPQGGGQSARNSHDAHAESSLEFDRATASGETLSVHSPGLPCQGSRLKLREFSRALNGTGHHNQALVQTASTSAETRVASKYDHDSFLEHSNFASYKELVLREAEDQKQSTESTSTGSPKRFRMVEDKAYISQNSLTTEKDLSKFAIPYCHQQTTALSYPHPKQSHSSSPTKRNRIVKKHKHQQSLQKQQQAQAQPIPVISPFRMTSDCIRDSMNAQQVNFNSQIPGSAQLPTVGLMHETTVTKHRKQGVVHGSFMQSATAYTMDGGKQIATHQIGDRLLLKHETTGVSQREQVDQSFIIQSFVDKFSNKEVLSVTQSNQFSFQHLHGQTRPGRNLVHVKSPIGTNAVAQEWEHVSSTHSPLINQINVANEPLSAGVSGTSSAQNGTGMISRKSKLLARQKVNSIEKNDPPSAGNSGVAGTTCSSKLAFAGQQTLTNRKQSEYLAGQQQQQKVVIKDSLRAAGASLIMPGNNSKTMSNDINQFNDVIKRESSHSLLQVSPREKINVPSSVLRKNSQKKYKRPNNFDLSAEGFNSPPQKQASDEMPKARPFPQPSELLMLTAVTPARQQQQQQETKVESTAKESKNARQGSQFRATPQKKEGNNEYGDCVTQIASPPKKAGTKSCKKRILKKNKTNDQHFSGQSGAKSLQRQTTFDMQSMNGYMICGKESIIGAVDQKIDWLKLAKEERTIAGSKMLTQAAELSAQGMPLRQNQVGAAQFSYQGSFKMTQNGEFIKPSKQLDPARTHHKSFKGSRKATKSPIVNVRSVNGNQGSVERQITKKKSLDGLGALISGQQVGCASVSTSIGNMVQLGSQSPDQYYRQSQKHKNVAKSKAKAKKMLKEGGHGEGQAQSLYNGILSSNSEQFRPVWPVSSDFSGTHGNEQKNMPIKNFCAGSHLDQVTNHRNNKTTSRAAVMSILNGTPDLRHRVAATATDQQNDLIQPRGQLRTDLEDLQKRLRPRNFKYEHHHATKLDEGYSESGDESRNIQNGRCEEGPKRTNTTSGVPSNHNDVSRWLFGTQQ